MNVYLNPQGGTARTVKDLKSGASVREILEREGVSASGYSVRVNGSEANLGTVLNEDDVVTLARNVEAG